MKVRKRDGRYVQYDEGKVSIAMVHAGVPPGDAGRLATEVTRNIHPPVTVSNVGDSIEREMIRAGLHEECRRFIAYRQERRAERAKRSGIIGSLDESLKRLRPATLRMLKGAGDIHEAVRRIRPDAVDLIMSGRFIPDDIIVREGEPRGPYRLTMPHRVREQLECLRYTDRYALYVDWNRTPQSFRDAFRAVCAHTGCLVREGRYGGMLDISRIPLHELASTARAAADFLAEWPGASGPGVMVPPGMDHRKVRDILYGELPDLEVTAVHGQRSDVWGDAPYRGGCPECGGELIMAESCMSCACGWSACSS